MADIEREGGIKSTARRTMMKVAEAAGYLTFARNRNAKGQFESAYTVHEEPVEESERTRSWEVLSSPDMDEPPPDNPRVDSPLMDEPQADGMGDLQKTEVQTTDLQKTERDERTESASKPKLALVSSVGENPHLADQPFSPNDDFSQPAPRQEWTVGERFILKTCGLWDDLANQEKPIVETNWKTKQAVQAAGKYVAARLDVASKIGGTPKMFLEFWHDELKRLVTPRPDYVVEQWEAYDRWLIANYETHRRIAA